MHRFAEALEIQTLPGRKDTIPHQLIDFRFILDELSQAISQLMRGKKPITVFVEALQCYCDRVRLRSVPSIDSILDTHLEKQSDPESTSAGIRHGL